VTICDAYHAITSERPYGEARPHEEAIAELRRCAGGQFDPELVDVFCTVAEDFAAPFAPPQAEAMAS
jgi:HD-GYP domain-containing protein (c-di-GMP phosphodiesterase class II)